MKARAPQSAPASAVLPETERQIRDAIDALTEANRSMRDPESERRLVQLRHELGVQMDSAVEPGDWPTFEPADPLPANAYRLPSVTPDELTPETLTTGIRRQGCVHVRRLLPERMVTHLIEAVDRSFEAFDSHQSGASIDETTPWFEPFQPGTRYSKDIKQKLWIKRKWLRDAGGVWPTDSPRGLFDLFEAFHEVGLTRLITAYLGEPPALALDKCTFRRMSCPGSGPRASLPADWHQDGVFLGDGIRTVNVWMSLSHCGQDAPGLDVVPRRLDRVLETGTDGAMLDWAVGPGVVERVSVDAPVSRPLFEPGDVLLFDEMFLHRTAKEPTMTRERYAVETWFFAPSIFPGHPSAPRSDASAGEVYIPIAV
jgi:Phytanoyl-CoA dioxygenase (PhyH)